jgi:hypothetical protein
VVDSSSAKTRNMYSEWWKNHKNKLDVLFKKCGVDYTLVNTREEYVVSLMNLFKKRALKQ